MLNICSGGDGGGGDGGGGDGGGGDGGDSGDSGKAIIERSD